MQLNDKWQGLCWPMMDFLRCVTAALIYFAISITAVAKYSDGASKAAGVFGFFATIVFAVDFYLIFNEVAKFLKQGSSADETTANKAEGGWPRYGESISSLPTGRKCFHGLVLISLHAALNGKPLPSKEPQPQPFQEGQTERMPGTSSL
uniref:CKLF like MARVEL transmembrane domain containing 3 n=1 Tax=Sus scrofa TaxID=9823 RepID=A0A8D1UA04_PIG